MPGNRSESSWLSQMRCPCPQNSINRGPLKDLLTNRESALVTDAILAMAKGLHLQVTAEGIETQEQLAYLRRQGCHEGQGFYFSPPIPAEAMTHTLARARTADRDRQLEGGPLRPRWLTGFLQY
jgi:EAL domain-containing protein (putative c-di-GMP-specific phosphodiesterase class I)